MEGNRVDIVLIITRYGAPNTADCPPQYAIVAERTPLPLTEDGPRVGKRRSGGVRRREKFESLSVNSSTFHAVGMGTTCYNRLEAVS